MAKSTITRKSALSAAIIAFDFLNMESIRPEGMPDVDYMEVKEVLGNMLAQVSKPRAKAVSKARKMNENLANEITKAMAENGTPHLTSKEIVALGMPEVTTTQKAAAVMRVAEELGLVAKIKDGKKIFYQLAENVEGE